MTAAKGVAEFTCAIDQAGSGYKLSASTASLSSATSTAIDVALPAGAPVWSQVGMVPSSEGTLAALSCAAPTTCVAVGKTPKDAGLIVATANGGKTWTQLAAPSGTGPLAAVSCPTTAVCLAAGMTTLVVPICLPGSGRQILAFGQ